MQPFQPSRRGCGRSRRGSTTRRTTIPRLLSQSSCQRPSDRSRRSRQRAWEWTEIVAGNADHNRIDSDKSIRFPLFISGVFKNLFGSEVPLISWLRLASISKGSADPGIRGISWRLSCCPPALDASAAARRGLRGRGLISKAAPGHARQASKLCRPSHSMRQDGSTLTCERQNRGA
jgi:hypothetical protein